MARLSFFSLALLLVLGTLAASQDIGIPDVENGLIEDENNVTCVMVQGTISFTVNYTAKANKTEVVTVTVPEHGAAVTGSCNGTEGEQYIEITWGPVNETSSTRMTFNRTKDTWSLIDFTATVFMGKNFVNATVYGEKLDLVMNYNFSPLEIGVNRSFNCHSHLSAFNVTGSLDGAEYDLPLGSDLTNIQIQAYNEIIGERDFVDSVHCTADNTSDVVPIAVGCALAGLVVIVLIAYLVGRRRRSAAYQSV
ncbi:putative lysosome-associated membrane glycoprotein 1 [Penaeus vannamei]|uniref:Putative lysosome-associated membrane glycoprotein 1 n=1 Tax=Penaeus vannamei TaxID=6689 RepID=A0A423TD31_PENVA|nr:putative lysosome-associated membrane glycoprotein 1 [Penaeus vannamei]